MSSLRLTRLVAATLALVLVAGACSSDTPTVIVSGNDPRTAPKDVAESLDFEGFTVMTALLDEAGLAELLQGDEDSDTTYTVFAPTDAAFDELVPGLVELLGGDDDVVAPAPEGGDTADAADEPATDDDEPATDDDTASTATELAPRPSRSEIQALLADILENHIVEDSYLAADLPGSLTSVEGSTLSIGEREEPPATEDGDPPSCRR